jgi:hypothetical protein
MEINKRNLKMVVVDELIAYDRNPRQHPASQIEELKNSIRQWGWTIPILIDESNTVLAGHGRLFAAKELRIKSVPCIVAENWSEEQKKAYVIADNKLAENSAWDPNLYLTELKALDDVGFDLTLAGFDEDFISNFSYTPNFKPETSYDEITGDQIDRASDELSEISNRSDKVVALTCPNCGNDFEYSGI